MRKRIQFAALAASLVAFGYVWWSERGSVKKAPESGVPGQAMSLMEDHTTPGRCELHHVPFAVEVIPAHFGFWPGPGIVFNGFLTGPEVTRKQFDWLREEHAAWRDTFRFSHLIPGVGGTAIPEASFAKISYCPECRKADDDWHANHAPYPADDPGAKVQDRMMEFNPSMKADTSGTASYRPRLQGASPPNRRSR